MARFISINNVADVLGVSQASIRSWVDKGLYPTHTDNRGNVGFCMEGRNSL